MSPAPSSEKADLFALAGAAVTGTIHLLTGQQGANKYFVVGASLFWITFVIIRARQDRTILRTWGFKLDNLRESARLPLLFFSVSAATLAAYALVKGHFSFPLHTVLLLLFYPFWGVIQQFLVLGIVVGNLQKLEGIGSNRLLLIITGAIVFSSVHIPDFRLTAGTLMLALLYVPHFLRYRNVLPLGLVHGWLGSLFNPWALNKDPWLRTFG